MSQRVFRAGVAVLLVIGTAACNDAHQEESALEPSFTSAGAELVECPSTTSYETSGSVLPLLGGEVSLRGHSVSVPIGAVLTPTTIGLAEPASRYMLIELSANGQEHFQFNAPLTVTISYARCTRANIEKGALTVWLVDPATGELLANMGGIDDKEARTITFETDHFSGYAIAN